MGTERLLTWRTKVKILPSTLSSELLKFFPCLGPLHVAYATSQYPTSRVGITISVWLRHLVKAKENDLIDSPPPTVLELGPGSSLGAGLAALLSGTTRLYSFDAVHAAKMSIVLKVFDELVGLFRDRESIPDNNEFPEIFPPVETCDFPRDILSDDVLEESLSPRRVALIWDSISSNHGSFLVHKTSWSNYDIPEQSVDMTFSQAVLEHVDDLPILYQAMNYWLKPGGCVSHTIDFRSHGIGKEWNSH